MAVMIRDFWPRVETRPSPGRPRAIPPKQMDLKGKDDRGSMKEKREHEALPVAEGSESETIESVTDGSESEAADPGGLIRLPDADDTREKGQQRSAVTRALLARRRDRRRRGRGTDSDSSDSSDTGKRVGGKPKGKKTKNTRRARRLVIESSSASSGAGSEDRPEPQDAPT